MTIKVREPGEAFKRQVTEFVPVKKRRPWRDEEATDEKETLEPELTSKYKREVQGATSTMANAAIVERQEESSASMANAAIAQRQEESSASMAAFAIAQRQEESSASMANAAIAQRQVESSASMANAAIIEPVNLVPPSTAITAISKIENPGGKKSVQPDSFALPLAAEHMTPDLDPNLARSQRARASFVFNIAIRKIGNPMDSLLFCYLWHRVEETGTNQIKITLNEMSEAIGASKRGIQDAVRRLTETGLIENINAGTTYVPILRLAFKFKK